MAEVDDALGQGGEGPRHRGQVSRARAAGRGAGGWRRRRLIGRRRARGAQEAHPRLTCCGAARGRAHRRRVSLGPRRRGVGAHVRRGARRDRASSLSLLEGRGARRAHVAWTPGALAMAWDFESLESRLLASSALEDADHAQAAWACGLAEGELEPFFGEVPAFSPPGGSPWSSPRRSPVWLARAKCSWTVGFEPCAGKSFIVRRSRWGERGSATARLAIDVAQPSKTGAAEAAAALAVTRFRPPRSCRSSTPRPPPHSLERTTLAARRHRALLARVRDLVRTGVRDARGLPLEFPAFVHLHSVVGSYDVKSATGEGAAASFQNVAPGDYEVEVRATGYQSKTEPVTVVSFGGDFSVYIYLQNEASSPTANLPPGRVVMSPKLQNEIEKGLAAARKKEYAVARAHFLKASKMAPGNPDVLYLLGTSELGLRDLDAARLSFNSALNIEPSNQRVLLALAEIDLETGDTSSAIVVLEGVRPERRGLAQHISCWPPPTPGRTLLGSGDPCRARCTARRRKERSGRLSAR